MKPTSTPGGVSPAIKGFVSSTIMLMLGSSNASKNSCKFVLVKFFWSVSTRISSSGQKSAEGISQARLGFVLSQRRFFSFRNQESRLSPTAKTLTALAVPPQTPAMLKAEIDLVISQEYN